MRASCAVVALLPVIGAWPQYSPPANAEAAAAYSVPRGESLDYHVEWRLIHAGNARLTWSPSDTASGWDTSLTLESVGLVSRLYKVNNEYSSELDHALCALNSLLKTNEGKKHRETKVSYDQAGKKATYLERDVVKDAVVGSHQIDIPGCVYDVIGALYRLRTLDLPVGQATRLPVSDGKKSVMARIEAQERETVKISGVRHKTIRYEAFLFNNVLYRRSGRLFVWLTDDERRIPVQIRIRLPFYIGTVTLQLRPERKT